MIRIEQQQLRIVVANSVHSTVTRDLSGNIEITAVALKNAAELHAFADALHDVADQLAQAQADVIATSRTQSVVDHFNQVAAEAAARAAERAIDDSPNF